MLPASVIIGEIVDPDGNPLASHYISVTAADMDEFGLNV